MPPIIGLVHPDDVEKIRTFVDGLANSAGDAHITHRLRTKSGVSRWFDTRAHRVVDDGKLVRFYTTSRDVDDRVAAERKLEALSITDELTQLHNRRGFQLFAGQQHAMAVRQKRPLTLLFADLDGLKRINDELGHERGDAAIREFGKLLKSVFRTYDTVARLESVVREFNATAGVDFRLGASVGSVALAEGSNETLDQLVARGDEAMYRAKRAKRT